MWMCACACICTSVNVCACGMACVRVCSKVREYLSDNKLHMRKRMYLCMLLRVCINELNH